MAENATRPTGVGPLTWLAGVGPERRRRGAHDPLEAAGAAPRGG